MLDFHDSALDQIAFVELGQGAIDHRVHLVVGDVLEIDDIRVLDFGQNGPLSSAQGPFVMVVELNMSRGLQIQTRSVFRTGPGTFRRTSSVSLP